MLDIAKCKGSNGMIIFFMSVQMEYMNLFLSSYSFNFFLKKIYRFSSRLYVIEDFSIFDCSSTSQF